MSNKTISINPSSFKFGSSRTKKNKNDALKQKIVPLISSNVIKQKLLKRIKDHKRQETHPDLEKTKIKLNNNITNNLINSVKKETDAISNEFNESMDYLQILSNQKKSDERKIHNERLKEEIERRTLKNHESINQSMINIDLPEELMMSHEMIHRESVNNNELPYGNLKRGLKPTYKEWNKTLRNEVVTNPNSSLIIQSNDISSVKTARENRLNLLKEKIKNKNQEHQIEPINSIQPYTVPTPLNDAHQHKTSFAQIEPLSVAPLPLSVVPLSVVPLSTDKLIGTKHITKKTVKRKYTLGRSQIKRTVSILIKDNGTRKKIINAQKELKRKNINEIKLYLREHNLIKAGSSAPNDILRKLYENAMLAGEITNNNKDTLLYNLSKSVM